MLDGFIPVLIERLREEAINTFLINWCRALFPENAILAEQHLAKLAAAVSSTPEIRRMATNPVMLTALAVVHWNEAQLPQQRAELYNSIIEWLLKSRPDERVRVTPVVRRKVLQDLAFEMQMSPGGRRIELPRQAAAQLLAGRRSALPMRLESEIATYFDEEELTSGILQLRDEHIRFWHPTFQDFLAARALAGLPDIDQRAILQDKTRLGLQEWKEVLLLFAEILTCGGDTRTDSLITWIIDAFSGTQDLDGRARCVGLVGAILRDLEPLDYRIQDPRYNEFARQVMGIFGPSAATAIPLDVRIDAAEALGSVGDPRLRSVQMESIHGGKYLLGAQATDATGPNFDLDARPQEAPVHSAHLAPFAISRYAVTVQQFAEFVSAGGYRNGQFWTSGSFGGSNEPGGWLAQLAFPNHPVVNVSWFEAVAYCAWAGGRLPTEAEWEAAARGQCARKYPWGDDAATPDLLNFVESHIGQPTPVGVYALGETPEGVADLAGNVSEWCSDWFGPYTASTLRNPLGPTSGTSKVARGGGFPNAPRYCRAAYRHQYNPGDRDSDIGFRIVRAQPNLVHREENG